MPRLTIASVIRNGIANGATTDEVLISVRRLFPAANTTPACVAYYRSEANRRARVAGGAAPVAVRSRRGFVLTTPERAFDPAAAMTTPAFDADTLSGRAFGIEFEFVRTVGRSGQTLGGFAYVVREALRPFGREGDVRERGYANSDGTTWDVKVDSSCEYELATPRLTKADWPKVIAVLEALVAAGAKVDARCGMHVHHETRGAGPAEFRNILRMWGAFEEPLHEALPSSRRSNTYCPRRLTAANAETWARRDDDALQSLTSSRGRRGHRGATLGHYSSINMSHFWRSGRIEIRSHHGTLDAHKAGHWVALVQAMLDRAIGGEVLAGFRNWTPRERIATLARYVPATSYRALTAWARRRNADYFNRVTTEAA